MTDETRDGKMLKNCFNPPHQGDIITFIEAKADDNEMINLLRISISTSRVVIFIADDEGKMRKVKLAEGLNELDKEIRASIENANISTFTVSCNGYTVNEDPLNALNILRIVIENRRQVSKSKNASKARRRKVLAGQVLDLLDHAEEKGRLTADKELRKLLVPVAVEMTEEEKEDLKINTMLEQRLFDKGELDKRSFGQIVSDATEEVDEVTKEDLIQEV
jgi:hypothetical protein